MRALTEVETQTLFRKLADYTGRSLNLLISPSTDPAKDPTVSERHVFRIHNSRVYYVRESMANLATSVARPNLLSLGTCLGKFTKTGKFRIHITALDVIAPHARYKVWVKPNGEMPFLYGGNLVKAHIGRWSEDCPQHQGVVVLAMDDTPLVSSFNELSGCSALIGFRASVFLHAPPLRLDDLSQLVLRRIVKQILESTCEKKTRYLRRRSKRLKQNRGQQCIFLETCQPRLRLALACRLRHAS